MQILLSKNRGYAWFNNKKIYFKGYFIENGEVNNTIYKEQEAIDKLSKVYCEEDFVEYLKKIDGCYSIIYDFGKCICACTDISRSFPLFYDKNNMILSDSAEVIRQKLNIKKQDVDKDNLKEFRSNFYLFSNRTIYDEIKQLDLGEVALFSNEQAYIKKYYKHIGIISNDDINKLSNEFIDLSFEVFNEYKKICRNKQIVLSLSGGYDSRYVACMLKEVGIDNVICYSYGKSNSFEIKMAKKVAESLNYRMIFVEHTDDLIIKYLDDEFIQYINYYDSHDCMPYLQNYFAVRYLVENKLIPENSIFLTGLCNDMPTGSYINNYKKINCYDIDSIVNAFFDLLFKRYNYGEKYKNKWVSKIKKLIDKYEFKPKNLEDYYQVMDCLFTSSIHSHDYMNMNKVHDFFNYKWLLPCWNKKLLNFWYKVSSKYKIDQYLYKSTLMNTIFKKYKIDRNKVIMSYGTNLLEKKFKYLIGGIINFIMLNLGIPFKRKYDYNNFAILEMYLFKNIKNKNHIKYSHAGAKYLINEYYIQYKYNIY